jgi:hypothetical protein
VAPLPTTKATRLSALATLALTRSAAAEMTAIKNRMIWSPLSKPSKASAERAASDRGNVIGSARHECDLDHVGEGAIEPLRET